MTFHEDMKYWVWLQRAAGKGANLERLLSPFGGDVRALYETDPGERERMLRETPSESEDWWREEARSAGARGGLLRDGWRADGQEVLPGWQRERGKSRTRKKRPVAESTLQRMKKVSLAEAEETLELCERTGVVPICPADDRYPWLLREVPTCPAVLYALGDLRLLTPTTLPFAMVGARDARLSSLSAASDLAGSLARAGFLIVSGGAIGTDSACHIGALNAGCPTVAVLGTGIGTNYLQQNADLRRVISHNGLLLSEMEPGEPGSRGSFPLRNRIIAGMSVGTLVVEAAVKSGSLITSKYAEEYDRDVFVPLFPGIDPERPLKSSAFRGTRELLERETGVGIRCAADVLAAYADSYGLDPAALVASGQVSEEDLTRDVTDLAGVFPPLLSRAMVAKARAQLGLCPGGPASGLASTDALSDLAGSGTLNPNPGWGPYRTAGDAELRTYTSAEFAYRRGDHPHADALPEDATTPSGDKFEGESSDSSRIDGKRLLTEGTLALSEGDFEGESSGSSRSNSKRLLTEDTLGLPADASGRSPKSEPATPFKSATPLKPVKDLSQEARVVLACFRDPDGQPLYYEDISARIDMAPQYLLAALTELSLASYIDLTMDQQYVCAVDLEEVWPA
jgi:DNA protecting protein DprA